MSILTGKKNITGSNENKTKAAKIKAHLIQGPIQVTLKAVLQWELGPRFANAHN